MKRGMSGIDARIDDRNDARSADPKGILRFDKSNNPNRRLIDVTMPDPRTVIVHQGCVVETSRRCPTPGTPEIRELQDLV